MTPEIPAPATGPVPARALAAAGAWTLLVLVLTLWPGDSFPALGEDLQRALPGGSDKIVHALLFLFETIFVARALRALGHQRPLLAAIAAAASLAALTELLQLFTPSRSGDLADFAADQIGIAAYAGTVAVRRALGAGASSPHDHQAPLTGYES